MDLPNFLSLLSYDFVTRSMIASVFAGILCSTVGMFLVLRKLSLLGDTLSHSSLAGASIGLLIGSNPIIGAFIFSALAGLLIDLLHRKLPNRSDVILATVLAFSAGIAVTLMSTGKLRMNAESFLFGSVLTVDTTDLQIMAFLTAVTLLIAAIYRHELINIAFDERAAMLTGIRVRTISLLFTVLTASSVAVAIKLTGALVISSMIALPVASALQFEVGFYKTYGLAVCFAVLSALCGIALSCLLDIAPGGASALFSGGLFATVSLSHWVIKKAPRQ